jgi:protein-S-isoprenylcysteine O-methyltransferase Ste14
MSKNLRWGQRGEWYVVIQILLFGLIFFAPLVVPALLEWPAPWNVVGIGLGIALALVGGLIAFGGVLSLGTNLTAVPYPKEDAALVERGAYRIVRHPIYSGIIFGAFGWAFFNNSLLTLLLALVLFIFFDVKSRREEGWLCEKYPNYPAYQARVRKLIPLIY